MKGRKEILAIFAVIIMVGTAFGSIVYGNKGNDVNNDEIDDIFKKQTDTDEVLKPLTNLSKEFLKSKSSSPDKSSHLKNIAQPTLSGKTLYVGGTGPNNYTKIQDAIDNASDGDTVFVYSGIYYENVVINKRIKLVGEDKETTIIDGGGGGSTVYITADNVKISKFTIQDSGETQWDAGAKICSNNSTIINNIITSNNYWGILICYFMNNTISNNYINSNQRAGIWLYRSDKNILDGNIITSNGGGGIGLFEYSQFNNITNNIILNNSYGVYLYYNNANIITNNVIVSNDGYGIMLDAYTSNNEIGSNNISSNNGYGMWLVGSNNNKIVDNFISLNNDMGLRLQDSSGNTIIYNHILSNVGRGIYLHTSSNNNYIHHNNFINNAPNAFDVCSNQWDDGAEGNYWDDYTGSDNDGDGIGDTPYYINGGSNVDRYPLIHPWENYIGSYPEITSVIWPGDKPNEIEWKYNNASFAGTIYKFSLFLIDGTNHSWNLSKFTLFINNEDCGHPVTQHFYKKHVAYYIWQINWTGLDVYCTGDILFEIECPYLNCIPGVGDIDHDGDSNFKFSSQTYPTQYINGVLDGESSHGGDYPYITWYTPWPSLDPVADANGPYYGNTGEEILFDASASYDPNGDIVGYRWDWTNDGIWDTEWLSKPFASHIYLSEFYGKVGLEVKDSDGATDTITANVYIGYYIGSYPEITSVIWPGDKPNEIEWKYNNASFAGTIYKFSLFLIDGTNHSWNLSKFTLFINNEDCGHPVTQHFYKKHVAYYIWQINWTGLDVYCTGDILFEIECPYLNCIPGVGDIDHDGDSNFKFSSQTYPTQYINGVLDGESSHGGDYPYITWYIKKITLDLTISPSDITFSKTNGTIAINVKIHSYSQHSSNIEYQMIDIYNNEETLIESGVIPYIKASNYEIITKTITLENPENHKIKIIVDPNDVIKESNEGNNVAIKQVDITEEYKLTSVNLDGRLYYVMFKPLPSFSASQIQSLFDNKDSSFVDGIEELWIVDSQNPTQKIGNKDNKIGKILYKIVSEFYPSPPSYEYDNAFHNVEAAEKICDTVRNRWLFDILSLSHWFDELYDLTKGDTVEMLKLWEYTIMGPLSGYVPYSDLLTNAFGATLALTSFALTLENNWGEDASLHFESLSKIEALNKFKNFLQNSKFDKVKKILILQDPFTPSNIIRITLGKAGFEIPPDVSERVKKFIKFLNEEGFDEYMVSVSQDFEGNVMTLLDYQRIHSNSAHAILNRLKVLRDIMYIYYPDADIINELNGSIRKAKIDAAIIDGYINPPDINAWDTIAITFIESLCKMALNKIFEDVVKGVIYETVKYTVTQLAKHGLINLGKAGLVTATEIASYATAVLAGWDLGLALINWGEVTKYEDIAKIDTEMGHYKIDNPTFILSDNGGVNNESLYSSILKSSKMFFVGSGYYNYAMSLENLGFGILSWTGISKPWREMGDICYTKAKNVEEGAFSLFNSLASLCEVNPNSFEYEDVITIPSIGNSLDINAVTTTEKLMNIGWLDGGLRFYCTNFDLYLDVTTTKIGDNYVVTINPFEETHGLLVGYERVEQIKNHERIQFKLFSGSGEIYDTYWGNWYYTNRLHNLFSTTGEWYESPWTVVLPWEPTMIEVKYGWQNDPWIGDPYWINCHKTFSLNTLSKPSASSISSVDGRGRVSFISNASKLSSGNISYFTWDSDGDMLNDALTISWNLSDYQSLGNATVSALVIGGNVSGNASVDASYLCGRFSFEKEAVFSFNFYANRTDNYDVYLYLRNASSLMPIDSQVLTNISLYKGSGDPSGKEKILNASYQILDVDKDYVTDGINLSFSVNSTLSIAYNCSFFVALKNASGAIVDVDYTEFNLSTSPTNITYFIANLTKDMYEILAYLTDGNHKIEGIYQNTFDIGINTSSIFTGEFFDYGNDTNNDTLYNFLSIKVGIKINESGNYTLKGILRNSSGYYIGEANARCLLSKGIHNVTLNFNSSMLTIYGKNDSFALTSVALYDENNTLIALYSPGYHTNHYNVSSFEPSPLSFLSATDEGIDTDNDGYYNYLQINVSFNVSASGNYTFELRLTNGSNSLSIFAWNSSHLISGNNTVCFLFDGVVLRNFMQNTTYHIFCINVYSGNLFVGVIYPTDSLGYYEYTEFQPLLILLDNYSESLIDENNNSLYDYLRIDAEVNVTQPDNYTVKSLLYTSDGLLLDTFRKTFNLSKGIRTISLLFNGTNLYRCMNNTSFVLKGLKIWNSIGNLIETRDMAYTTQTYNYSQFEPSEIINCIAINDRGLDVDDNGVYDYLLLNVSVNVSKAGNYTLRGYLYDSNGSLICMASNSSFLANGTDTLSLLFSGPLINYFKTNGPYNVADFEIYDGHNDLVFLGKEKYTTSIYSYSQFEPLLLSDLKISSNDIDLSKTDIEPSEMVLINATIHNAGDINVSGIVVQFYEENASGDITLIGAKLIVYLNVSSSQNVSISWRYQRGSAIYVVVDPTNEILEGNESNNQAYIYPDAKASFTYTPSSPTTQNFIRFIDMSSDIVGVIINWTWDFDDGNISYEQNPIHRYADDGIYNVSLTVKDNNGVTDTTFQLINVSNVPPIASFTFSPCSTDSLLFIDISSDNDGYIINWTWDFGDGNVSYEQNPTHQYTHGGTYSVTLTVTDDDGATDSISQNVSVWSHRKPINLWLTSGSTPANYQVLLNISYNASMNPDFSDLRFIRYVDNTTELDHWIEKKVDSQWAHVWVEIADNITTENKTLAWMYYGNPNATSASNGEETFLFFDDFNDGIYRDKWNIDENSGSIGTAYQFNGKLFLRTKEIDRTISLITKESFESLFDNDNGTVLEYDVWTRYNPPYPKGKDGSLRTYILNETNNKWIRGMYAAWSGNVKLDESNGNVTILGRTSRRTNNIHAFVSLGCNNSNAFMRWREINDPGWVEDDFNGSILTNMAGVTSVKIKLELHCGGSKEGKWSQVAFDNLRLRKHHDPEPEYYIGQ